MNCIDARRSLAGAPDAHHAPLAAHLQACDSCLAHSRRLQHLDALIRRALAVPLPAAPIEVHRERPRLHVAYRRAGWPAIAAAAVGAVMLWTALPRESLAGSLAAHLEHPTSGERPLSEAELSGALGLSKLRLAPAGRRVVYASSCSFRGHYVAHLQVESNQRTVTVLVMPQEHVAGRVSVTEAALHGEIIQTRHGAIAILSKSEFRPGELQEIAAWVTDAVQDQLQSEV